MGGAVLQMAGLGRAWGEVVSLVQHLLPRERAEEWAKVRMYQWKGAHWPFRNTVSPALA